MLSRVKTETEKLLAMLTDELGIDPKQIDLVFSGGRGYHVHVKDLAFRGWEVPSGGKRSITYAGSGWILQDRSPGFHHRPDGLAVFARHLSISLHGLVARVRRRRRVILRHLKVWGRSLWPGFLKKTRCDDQRTPWGIRSDTPQRQGHESGHARNRGEFRKRLNEKAALADEPVTACH